jgi:hypothetical protein
MKIRGLVAPTKWDEKGNVTAVSIMTFDEDEYLLEEYGMEKKLMAFIREEVEVSGEVRHHGGKKIITVRTYSSDKKTPAS